MNKIEEIMDLVRGLQDAANLGFTEVSQNRMLNNIEAALRELVERKPLSDEEVFNIYCNSDSTINTTSVNLALFARAIERAHGIGA